MIPKKVWVFRCNDGCQGISASMYRRVAEEERRFHKRSLGHKGKVELEETRVVIEHGEV